MAFTQLEIFKTEPCIQGEHCSEACLDRRYLTLQGVRKVILAMKRPSEVVDPAQLPEPVAE